jgi:2-polyprenyl-6-methoxyphenol hydroxylase-like FAD-dependent oxidoreductase
METPLLIVGAGPTGLVLALWLAKSGISFRIIEKNSGPGVASRAMVVQARTLEFYRQLGIAEQVVDSGIKLKGIHLRDGSREVAGFPFGDIGTDITPFPFAFSLPQDDHERLLVKLLEAIGVHVEWNTQLVRFKDDGQRVIATLQKAGAEENGEFAYVCGCDGAHSTVRQGLNLNFPGGTYEEIFFVADVQASGMALNQDVNLSLNARSFCLAFPVRSSGMFRLIGVVPKELAGREHLTFEEIRPHVKKQMDVDVQKVNWFSTYHVHHRVADHFRQGRLFIAGDAGHIHSPAGGQGMNTGIGDAVNLGWKLASVLRGRANPSILDTYESERIAFARILVATTDRLFQVIVGRGLWSRMVRGFFLPHIAPVLLRFRAMQRAQFRLVSQTRIHYPDSALSSGTAGKIRGGDRVPWLQTQDNFKPLGSLDWQIHIYGTPTDASRAFSARYALPIHSFNWNPEARSAGFAQDAAYLIRPDGHVAAAWPDQNVRDIEKFASEWLELPGSGATCL